MTIVGSSTVKVLMITAVVIISELLFSRTGDAKEIISLGLVTDNIQWSDHEIIVGGHLRLKGGIFEIRSDNAQRSNVISSFGSFNWPFQGAIENDPKNSTASLSLSLLLIGQPHDTSWLKRTQLFYLSNWFNIEISGASHSLVCPSKECPIEIDGELEFGDPNSPDFHSTPYREVKVKTSDFVFKDITVDISKFKSKAEQGDVKAQYELGTLYYNRETPGVKQDFGEALKWFRKAADQGYAPAQNRVGECYAQALGLPRNLSEGMKWWRLAAENGNSSAQSHLGTYYLGSKLPQDGQVIERDYVQAIKWLQRASDQGENLAQSFLGKAYETGQGVTQDYSEAYFWYSVAAVSAESADAPAVGRDELIKHITEQAARVEKHLTSDQIKEIKQRITAWKPKLENSTAQR